VALLTHAEALSVSGRLCIFVSVCAGDMALRCSSTAAHVDVWAGTELVIVQILLALSGVCGCAGLVLWHLCLTVQREVARDRVLPLVEEHIRRLRLDQHTHTSFTRVSVSTILSPIQYLPSEPTLQHTQNHSTATE